MCISCLLRNLTWPLLCAAQCRWCGVKARSAALLSSVILFGRVLTTVRPVLFIMLSALKAFRRGWNRLARNENGISGESVGAGMKLNCLSGCLGTLIA